MPYPPRKDDYVGRTLHDAAGAGHGLIAGVVVILLICGGITFLIGLVQLLGPVGIVLLILGSPFLCFAGYAVLVIIPVELKLRAERAQARRRDASRPSSF